MAAMTLGTREIIANVGPLRLMMDREGLAAEVVRSSTNFTYSRASLPEVDPAGSVIRGLVHRCANKDSRYRVYPSDSVIGGGARPRPEASYDMCMGRPPHAHHISEE